MIGKTLGHYTIVDKIGRGGMGEVYRARDARLDRDVALKVLPEDTAKDPERVRRFQREAKAVAALNHPNIVTIHSVEEIEGRQCLTMELVEGKTLSDLIPADGMPLERFFKVAIPLADALAAAHTKGITHRDLKPSNIMVDSNGRVKILDFGLAKLFAPPDASEEATVIGDDSVTAEGKVVGTVHYMSPEQAEAKPIDHRSDIFSLGVVLYEMATGQRPFRGDTPISTISAILKEKPPSVTDLRAGHPRHLARVINRCIEKNPDKRFQTARDVCNELEGLQQEIESGEIELASGSMSSSSLTIPARKARNPWPWVVGIVVIAAVVVAYFAFLRSPQPESTQAVKSRPMTSLVGTETPGSWSPDGGFFTYSHSQMGPLDIFVVSAAGGDPIKLVESPYDDVLARWSPDNRWIAFASNRDAKSGIYLIPPLGGQIQKLAETGVPPLSNWVYGTLGANPWSPDGRTLVFSRQDEQGRGGLWTIDLQTRQEQQLTTPDTGHREYAASFSPTGDRILFSRSAGSETEVCVMPAAGGESKTILTQEQFYMLPTWFPDGRRVVFSPASGGLWALDIGSGKTKQLTTGETDGAPVVSRNGQILYATFSHQTDLYTQDLDGSHEERLTFHTLDNFGARISHDGSRVAYASSRTGNGEIWLLDRKSGSERQLTNRDAEDWDPDWSPDDREIVFASDQGGKYGIWVVTVDGGALRKLGDHEVSLGSPKWSPDGSVIGFIGSTDAGEALFTIDSQGGSKRQVVENVIGFDWYVDAKHVVYATRVSGSKTQMRVVNIDTGEDAVLLDSQFGELCVAPDGTAVSYCSALSHANMNLHVLHLQPPASPDGLPQAVGKPDVVTHGEGKWHVHNGGWSPDSKQVIYTRDTDAGDVYLLEGAM